MIPADTALVLVAAGSLFVIGAATLVARADLIRMVMGLEFLGKGVSLLFILGGYLGGDTATSQAIVFTLIAIEAVVAALALALVIVLRKRWKTFDISAIARLPPGGDE